MPSFWVVVIFGGLLLLCMIISLCAVYYDPDIRQRPFRERLVFYLASIFWWLPLPCFEVVAALALAAWGLRRWASANAHSKLFRREHP